MNTIQLLFIGFVLAGVSESQQQHGVAGDWLTADWTAKVRIDPCGSLYCGRIMWEKASLQAKSTGAGVSTQPATPTNVGALIIKDFTPKDDRTLEGGKLYDPDSKKWYSGQLKLRSDGRLDVRGWVGLPAFGQSEVWTRIP